MGLFYTALERAEKRAGQRPAGAAVAEPPADAIAAAPPASAAERELRLGAISLDWLADHSATAREQYRILRTRTLEAMRHRGQRTLLITSTVAAEGKTTVAANLALHCSSLREVRVLLVDADLRHAGLSTGLRPPVAKGLNDLLRGEAGLEQLLLPVDPWLAVLPTLPALEQAPELLAGQAMVDLLQQAQQDFDLVVLDGAPVGPVADSRILARLVDASLLVARAGRTPTEALAETAALLRPGLLGTVLNGARPHHGPGYGQAYVDEGAAGSAIAEARA